jgi:hypothetical protein
MKNNIKLKELGTGLLLVAGISLILGIISRVTLQPFGILPGLVTAQNFLEFADTLLLSAIAIFLLALLEKK